MTNPAYWAVLLGIGLCGGILLCLEAGYRIGRRSCEKSPEAAYDGLGGIEAAIFALLGLLLGFSFAGGTSRLDIRRQLIVEEANAIGTAYLRLDLLPAESQPPIRNLFHNYLNARIGMYEKLRDTEAAEEHSRQAEVIQQEIWSKAVIASQSDQTKNAARLLLPALNSMIDVTTTRAVALHTRLPALILYLLVSVALLSGLLAGYAMSKRGSRSLLHMGLYAVVIAFTVYAVADLNNPRSGLIRVDAADNALVKLRDSIR